MLKRIAILATLILAPTHLAEAQQPKKVHRLGYLSGRFGVGPREEVFRQALRELGYIEGQNLVVEWRFSKGKSDLFPQLAAELVRLKVDVIVTGGPPGTLAAKNATATIPIVMHNAVDPLVSGFVASLSRPGGNITGLTRIAPELSGKRLELLKETVPRVIRVAVLWNRTSLGTSLNFIETEAAAKALGLQLQSLELRSSEDLEGVFEAATGQRAGALIVLPTSLTSAHRTRIVDLAAKSRLPAIYPYRDSVEAGGLMSYSANEAELFRRAAWYVDKVLKGARPADLPVEQPTKFELVINLKTAKQIGVTIPPNVLVRADKVIK